MQYAVGYQADSNSWWKNPLFLTDLELDSPYNTYVYPRPPLVPSPTLVYLRCKVWPNRCKPHSYFSSPIAPTAHQAHLFSETYEEHLAKVELCR